MGKLQNRGKRILVSLLSAALVISAAGIGGAQPVSAAAKVVKISTVKELKAFAKKVNKGKTYKGCTVKLTKNLAFNGKANNFTPMKKTFQGTFDGGGHTISGLYVTNRSGFFASVGASGTVKNLTLKNCKFIWKSTSTLPEEMGSIAGTLSGKLDNCRVIGGRVTDKTTKSTVSIGGLVGLLGADSAKASITNCFSSAAVSSAGEADAGGIAGYQLSGRIYNSCNTGKVTGSRSGGIVGTQAAGSVIQNCCNVGKAGCGLADDAAGTVSYSYCSEESSSVNFNTMSGTEKENKAYPASWLKTDSFVANLNKNAASHSGWRRWSIRKSISPYPIPLRKLKTQKTVSIAVK